MVVFDRLNWNSRLSGLPYKARVAFAAGCAVRLYGYRSSSLGDEIRTTIGDILRSVCEAWPDIEGRRAETLEALMTLEASPSLDDDAVACTVYLLRCVLSRSSSDAAFVAERSYNAVDAMVADSMKFTIFSPEIESAILASVAVQRELQQQTEDLMRLETGVDDGGSIIRRAVGLLDGQADNTPNAQKP